MLLTELLTAERVRVPLSSRSKDEVLRELVELATRGHPPDDVEAALAAVREREQLLSTGIGAGVAIPHGKTPVIDQLVLAAGVTAPGIEFDALDGEPVQLFFLVLGPESAAGAHVKVLSRISRLLRREPLRQALRTVGSEADFLRIVRASEAV
ncbi:MAG TPA: PTS sugar transporter subunit IIA [Gemmatimonadaceae bacterium]|nr:PTS sugar transporter subunit IIA [Gemmatimonadaceae bacterium]